MGGYTSAEVLIHFLLTVIDAEPDMIVLYHSANDIRPSLTPGFRSDYSHSRRNLAERHNQLKILSKIPYMPLAFYNYALFPEMAYSLIHAVSRGVPDNKIEFQGESAYKRNIEHIIHVCKANGIEVILSTFCRYLYEGIKHDPGVLKLHEGISRENRIMRELADKHSLALVDNNNLVPREEEYFVDHVHFSPLGMKTVAENISKPVISRLRQLWENSESR